MEIAVDSFSFYKHFGRHWFAPSRPCDVRWYCQKCADLGMDGLHIDPYHYNLEKDMAWIREFASYNNMYIELGACGTTVDELLPYIKAASISGCSVIRTFIGGSCLDDRSLIEKRVKKAKSDLKSVIPYARDAGISIAIENHGDIFTDDMEYILGLDSDCIGMCYDSGNFAFTGEDPINAIELFSDKIMCTHLKDVCPAASIPGANPFETIGEPVHFCALGEGFLPVKQIIDMLKEKGVDRMTLEICTSVVSGLSETKQLEAEMKAVESSIGYIKRFEAKNQ